MLNKTILQGKWRRLRGGLKMEWGHLTDNDRQQLDGKIDQMVGLFQERYGYTQERAAKAVTRYLERYSQGEATPAGVVGVWRPALVLLGLFGLATLAGFFFKPFWSRQVASLANELGVEETDTSPETLFA